MDIHSATGTVQMPESICDQIFEQAFSLDCLLADYLPDIFKILTCDVLPSVLSYTLSEGKITADLGVELRILYLSGQQEEQKTAVIVQKQTLQKQMEIPALKEGCTAILSVRPDSVRCRAVNPRRIDVRGAVLIRASAEEVQTVEYLAGRESGSGLQQKLVSCPCLAPKKVMTKEITLTEDSTLPYGNLPIGQILLYRCTPGAVEVQNNGNEVLCRGECRLHLLYQAAGENEREFQTAEFSVPFDAVLDGEELAGCSMDGSAEVIGCELSMEDGQNERLTGQYQLRIQVTAAENRELTYISDIYSTRCPVQKQTESCSVLSLIQVMKQRGICKNRIMLSEGIPRKIIDLIGDVRSSSLQKNAEGRQVLAVNLHLILLGEEEQGSLFCAEKTIPCELLISEGQEGETEFFPRVSIVSQSFTLGEDGALEVRTEFETAGIFCRKDRIEMVTGAVAEEDKPYPQTDAALRIYYAKAGESIWNIARAFRTGYTEAALENDLSGERLSEDKMLIIPMP